VPTGTESSAGVIAIDSSTAAVTVNVVVPVTLLIPAVIVVVPGIKVVANPPAIIVATAGFDEVQVAVLVKG
jgi:hypothetical protein